MAEKDDKKRALDLALSQIEKQYGKGIKEWHLQLRHEEGWNCSEVGQI